MKGEFRTRCQKLGDRLKELDHYNSIKLHTFQEENMRKWIRHIQAVSNHSIMTSSPSELPPNGNSTFCWVETRYLKAATYAIIAVFCCD